jgi:hypothetical protein
VLLRDDQGVVGAAGGPSEDYEARVHAAIKSLGFAS